MTVLSICLKQMPAVLMPPTKVDRARSSADASTLNGQSLALYEHCEWLDDDLTNRLAIHPTAARSAVYDYEQSLYDYFTNLRMV